MNQSNTAIQPEIYFHIGLAKTGSTFLQKAVFPKLKNIHYVPTWMYAGYERILLKKNHSAYFLSREFDQQMESELRQFAGNFPNAHIIMVLRRHDSWIASEYRRFVKNGFSKSFNAFIDIEEDTGLWKKKELDFSQRIDLITELFNPPPLILFHEDMKKDNKGCVERILKYANCTVDWDNVNLKPIHKSYSDKQLKAMRTVGKYILPDRDVTFKWKPVHVLYRWFKLFRTYSTLYGSLLIPSALMNKTPLIPKEQLDAIRHAYEADWINCHEKAKQLNTV